MYRWKFSLQMYHREMFSKLLSTSWSVFPQLTIFKCTCFIRAPELGHISFMFSFVLCTVVGFSFSTWGFECLALCDLHSVGQYGISVLRSNIRWFGCSFSPYDLAPRHDLYTTMPCRLVDRLFLVHDIEAHQV